MVSSNRGADIAVTDGTVHTLLSRNGTNSNGADGIVTAGAVTLTRNQANFNVGHGMNAGAGVINAGLNAAKGNLEVGPLARMLVAYSCGHQGVKAAVDGVLKVLGVGPAALFSTLGRIAAWAVEAQVMAAGLLRDERLGCGWRKRSGVG